MCLLGRMPGSSTRVSERDVNEGAAADDRIEQRAAPLAVRVVGVFCAEDRERVRALGDAELAALDAGQGLERRPRRPPAVRAVAVHGVEEFVGHLIVDGATKALSGKGAGACLHGRSFSARKYRFPASRRGRGGRGSAGSGSGLGQLGAAFALQQGVELGLERMQMQHVGRGIGELLVAQSCRRPSRTSAAAWRDRRPAAPCRDPSGRTGR